MTVEIERVSVEEAREIVEINKCSVCALIVDNAEQCGMGLFHAFGTTAGCYFDHIYDNAECAIDCADRENKWRREVDSYLSTKNSPGAE